MGIGDKNKSGGLRQNQKSQCLKIGSKTIHCDTSYKYLGIILTANGYFKSAILTLANEAVCSNVWSIKAIFFQSHLCYVICSIHSLDLSQNMAVKHGGIHKQNNWRSFIESFANLLQEFPEVRLTWQAMENSVDVHYRTQAKGTNYQILVENNY